MQLLGDRAFADAGDTHDAGHDLRRLPRPAEQVGQHCARKHVLHLGRHTRDRVDHPAGVLDDQTRCRSPRLLDDRGAVGDVGLSDVHLRHRTAELREPATQLLFDLRVADEPASGQRRDRLARDVVLRRAQPTRHDDRIRAGEGCRDRVGDPLLVVTDRRVHEAVHADRSERLSDVGRVRVDDVAEQQLGTHRYHLSAHRLATRAHA